MADVRIDTGSLTYTQFLIPESDFGLVEGGDAPTIHLEPGVYGFQQMSGSVASLRFEVTPGGLIDYDVTHEPFLDGRGTSTMIVRGFTITLDGRSLSHDLLPMVFGATILPRDRTHELTLIPAAGYGFQPASGVVADFRFDVDVNGEVVIDLRYAGFAQATERTLVVSGYRVTIDGRPLSHALLLVSMLGDVSVMPHDRTHEFTFIPAAGYGFQPASGIVADFRFDVDVNGEVVIDPRFAGFAQATGRTLVLNGYRVTIDGRPLSHALLLVSMLGDVSVMPHDRTHEFTFIPAAGYGFQPASGVVADFRFDVDVNGEVVIDPRFAGFAQATGRTLVLNGYRVTIDGRPLSHALLLVSMLGDVSVMPHGRTHEFTFIPAAGYGFQPASGIVADFRFDVDVNGEVVIDPRFAGFAQATGRTLVLNGYRVTIDGRPLSHALLLVSMLGDVSVMPHDRTHEFTFIPAAGYGFQPASGIVADFRFDVDVNGEVVIDPRFAGFAQATGRTLVVSGYRVTIDGRPLSHALLPVSMLGEVSVLSQDRTHEFTFIPAAGYGFQPATGIVADFRFDVDVNGSLVVDPQAASFAQASGRTLTITGYRITLDTGELSHDLAPSMLGWAGGLLSPGLHELTAIPAAGYGLLAHGGGFPDIRFSLGADGRTTLTDAPPGMTIMSSRRRCDVPDSIVTALQIQTYGSPDGRWSRGMLTISINLANAPDLGLGVVTRVIRDAFVQWQQVVPAFFNFTFVPNNGDIQAVFGGAELNPRFGKRSGTLASAPRPENGRVKFDSAEIWTETLLLTCALHEIGHALGLAHSDDPESIMSPNESGLTIIDAESRDALRNLYGWRPQIALTDRATSDRPAMAVTTHASLTFSFATLRMVWKGSRDDQSIYESALENNVWTAQRLVNGPRSSQSPSIASFPLNDGTPSTGLLMAWKGPDDDQGLYFATNRGTGWTAPTNVPNVGSSHRPAVADFGLTHMAWKGVRDDQGIYWSRLTAAGWEAQRNVAGVGTSNSPALVFFQNRLFMFWKGARDDSHVFFSSLEATPNAIWQPQRVVAFPSVEASGTVFVNIGTSHGPSATQHGNRILLAWKGIDGDTGIYFSLFDGNAFSGQIRVADVGTTEGPAVCRIGGFTHMAWKGIEGDNGIYWSTLQAHETPAAVMVRPGHD